MYDNCVDCGEPTQKRFDSYSEVILNEHVIIYICAKCDDKRYDKAVNIKTKIQGYKMKNIEIEFNDSLIINSFKEDLLFNVKMSRILDSNEYNVKVTLKCKDKNRRKTLNTVDEINLTDNYRKDIDDWLKINEICDTLKEELAIKLEEDFSYGVLV